MGVQQFDFKRYKPKRTLGVQGNQRYRLAKKLTRFYRFNKESKQVAQEIPAQKNRKKAFGAEFMEAEHWVLKSN